MRNGAVFFLGLFGALALAWAGIVLGSHAQLGTLASHFDENEGKSYPERPSGLAARGALVYADLNCVACHTQQMRRPDFGSDEARGWGDRQTYARDYISQTRVELGDLRVGPDLADLGARKPPYDPADLYNLLYSGTANHPSYRFLFTEQPVLGQRSIYALKLPARLAPRAGMEVVPSERARTLVSYLLSLNSSYPYPEEGADNAPPSASEGPEAVKKAPAGAPASATPGVKAAPHPSPAPKAAPAHP